MADSRPYRYGGTLVDTADVDQFVKGIQARDAQNIRDFGKTVAAGVITAMAITAYGRYHRGR